ncbi:rhodanese-like domain-containing protein [Hydrogenophaga sp. 5NK40-0174]|uniref:rhodanese-like domain-containing protein n=1 Tax=Hydrogenophaga sp. 5NK40-0174 TaxID=3127649 RepID=UPI0031033068
MNKQDQSIHSEATVSVSVSDLQALIAGSAPLIVDVRRKEARATSGRDMPGAIWRDPEHWLQWKDDIASRGIPLVLACAHGQEISQGLTTVMRVMGADARFLEGGIAAWIEAGGATVAAGTANTD